MASDERVARTGGAQSLDAPLHGVASLVALLDRRSDPVAAVTLSARQAVGAFAARDILAPEAAPLRDEALIDGRAVASSDLLGASPMSPAFVMMEPVRVCVGEPLPPGCDSVIDEALVGGAQGLFEVHGSSAPGEGVRRGGEDLRKGAPILNAGARISDLDAYVLEAAGVGVVDARRPLVRVVATPPTSGSGLTARLVASLVRCDGAETEIIGAAARNSDAIAGALAGEWDAAMIVGGSGLGDDDRSVEALRLFGDVVAHGLAIEPGRTGGAGFMGDKPVLCIPGRFDGALAVYLALGRPLLRRLSGASEYQYAEQAPLARKIASTVGLTQLVLLRSTDGQWRPLAVGDVTLSQMAQANAYILAPEGGEGFAEGAMLRPTLLPGRS